jgi:hypothetical protein
MRNERVDTDALRDMVVLANKERDEAVLMTQKVRGSICSAATVLSVDLEWR